ncbi:MAG: ABC transporter ATP-binding protein [Candidatus Howiella sp.]|jgi:ATP-binding cassette subfamily B multidrug efflux pump
MKQKNKEKKLLPYLLRYWKIAIVSPIFMLGEVLVDLLQPTLMSKIVDEGVLGGNMTVIIQTGLLMLGLVIVGGAVGVAAAGFASTASQNFGNDLRCDTFDRVLHLSLQQTDRFTTGSLVTRLTNDITAVQDLSSMALRMFVRAPISFIGGIIMAVRLNVNFGIVLLCALPFELVFILLILRKASPLFTVVQQKLDKVNAVVQENVTGARMVKAYVNEAYEEKRFKTANDDLMNTNYRVQRLMATAMPVLTLFMNAVVVIIILIGGWQAQAAKMEVGSIMAGVTYTTQILMSIMMVSMMFQTISRSRASAARIREVLNTEPCIEGGGERMGIEHGAVSFRNVSFRYPSAAGAPVLESIDLDIGGGENVAILGVTGAGKTSLVSLIPRFYDVTGGSVWVDGRDVREYDLDALRSRIGYVLQKSELFSGSIADNIRWGNPDASDEDVRSAARIAQADEFIEGFQHGYDTIIGEKGSSLSGGQKQRLCIARAILRNPEILIFDDSTSALDLGTEARLQKSLRENLNGTTVITIAQRVASVKSADRIVVLENGTVAACGSHEVLLKTSAVYRDIYNSQVGEGEKIHA